MANLRSAYAEQAAALLTWDGTDANKPADISIQATQTQADWQSGQPDIGGIKNVAAVTKGNTWTVSVTTTAGSEAVTITPTTSGN